MESFDSLGGPARPYILNTKAWLRVELGKLYKENDGLTMFAASERNY